MIIFLVTLIFLVIVATATYLVIAEKDSKSCSIGKPVPANISNMPSHHHINRVSTSQRQYGNISPDQAGIPDGVPVGISSGRVGSTSNSNANLNAQFSNVLNRMFEALERKMNKEKFTVVERFTDQSEILSFECNFHGEFDSYTWVQSPTLRSLYP